MQTFVNTNSEARHEIAGMKLAAGAILEPDDHYDSTDGKWQPAGQWAGVAIQPACSTTWVRPNAGVSDQALNLLRELVQTSGQHYFLTNRPWWKMVPTPRSAEDGRMDWQVRHPERVQELIDFGLIARVEDYQPTWGEPYPMYQPTAFGVDFLWEAKDRSTT